MRRTTVVPPGEDLPRTRFAYGDRPQGGFAVDAAPVASALMALTSAPTRVEPGWSPAPASSDVAIAAVALVGSLAVALIVRGVAENGHSGSAAHDPLGLALLVASTVPLVAWRRAPTGAFALSASAGVLLAGFGYTVGLPLGATAALYLLAASRVQDRPWTAATSGVVALLFAAYLGATGFAEGGFPAIELFHTGLAWAAAWFAGERARLRRDHLADLTEKAASAERDAERERLLAVAEERTRIARDLHDSAGHAINVIAVRAGAARLRHGQDPDRSLAALAAIEDLARQTGDEIDRFVGVLRGGGPGDGAVEALAGLASLGTLVSQHVATGLEVSVATSGVQRPLVGGADQAAFRILQEALTNAARHGAGEARVELGFGDESLCVTVTNPLHRESPAAATAGTG